MWLSTVDDPATGRRSDPTQKTDDANHAADVCLHHGALRRLACAHLLDLVDQALSIAQQYFIMHRYKAENPIDGLIGRLTGRTPAARRRGERGRPDPDGPDPHRPDRDLHPRGDRSGAGVLFARPVSFMMGAAQIEQPAPRRPARGRLRRPLQRRQVEPDQRPDRTAKIWRARRPSRGARARSTSSLLDGAAGGWWTCRVTALRWPARRPPRAISRTWAGPICAWRPNLKRVYLLIDARHGLKTVDGEALDALDLAAVSYQIVLTKADKLRPAMVEALIETVQPGDRGQSDLQTASRRLSTGSAPPPRKPAPAWPSLARGRSSAPSPSAVA